MALFLFIMQIIASIPTIIRIIMEISSLIKSLPKADQPAMVAELKTLVKPGMKVTPEVSANLAAFHSKLCHKLGKKS